MRRWLLRGPRFRQVTPKNCKRLAEADFPVAIVSVCVAREKSIRYGYPSILRLCDWRLRLATENIWTVALVALVRLLSGSAGVVTVTAGAGEPQAVARSVGKNGD